MKDDTKQAVFNSDGTLIYEGAEGSIHQIGRSIMDGSPCNGWDHWYAFKEEGELEPIDRLRETARSLLFPGEL